MTTSPSRWRRYQDLRPDVLESFLQTAPIVFWPLGLLEHHGWHLPVGFDGLKAERICIRVAERTGGVLLPTMWWGGLGGHGDFKWTLYQPSEAPATILSSTVERLIDFGFRVVVLFAGHYPWRTLLDRVIPLLQADHPESLIIWGTEMDIAEGVSIPGDHAACEETSYGMHLMPDLVDMAALTPGREPSAVWPGGSVPSDGHPDVCMDSRDALFAQMGDDARRASAVRGEVAITQVVNRLTQTVVQYVDALRAAEVEST